LRHVTPPHRVWRGEDADKVLLLSAEIHLAVTARPLSHPHRSSAADAETFPASAEAHSPGAHSTVALLRALLGGADPQPSDGLVHPRARGAGPEHVGDRLTLQRAEQAAPEGAGAGGLPGRGGPR